MSELVSTNGTAQITTEVCKENGASSLNQLGKDLKTVGPDGRMECASQAIVLEEYRFVPYLEQSQPAVSESLKQYVFDCFNYTLKHLEEWIMTDENDYVPNKEILIDVLAGQRARGNIRMESIHTGADCGLAKSLQKLFRLPLSRDMDQKVNGLLNDCKDIFHTDQLLSSLHTVEILKPCIDIVEENTIAETVQILEVGGEQNAMHHSIMAIADYYPSKQKVYRVAPSESLGRESIKEIQTENGEGSSKDQSVDLLILNHILHKQENIDKTLDAYCKLSKPGGFVLVKEVTGNFPLCLTLEALEDTTEFPRTRASRIFGRYLLDQQWSKLFSSHGFDVVYKRSDGVFATLYLLRKCTAQPDIAKQPVLFQMNDLHFPWLEDLSAKMRKMEMSKEESDRLWLLARKETNGLVGFLKCLRQETGGDKVRGVLVTNLKPASPKPQLSADLEEFQRLMQRDLVQNVYRDGSWGSFRHIPLSTDPPQSSPPSRAHCDPDKSYVIIVGSANKDEQDLGLALIQWLADRGAKKILLCNRTRNSHGKTQAASITNSWQARNVQVEVSHRDVTTVDGAWGLVNQAQTLAPLGGVFHIHWATRYGLFQRQTRESFQDVYDLKVQATVNLDHVTRSLCRESLDWFVVFSCSNAGRGRAGHTNSGFASSVVERISEQRQADKLHGLALQLDCAISQENGRGQKHPSSEEISSTHNAVHPDAIPSYLAALDALLPKGSCPVISLRLNKS